MEIQVVRTIEAIDALKPEWDALFQADAECRPFCSHAWISNAYRLSEAASPLLLLLYVDGRRLGGVFPFAIRRDASRWFKFDALVHGSSGHADYSSFVVAPDVNERVALGRVVEKLVELQRTGAWHVYDIRDLSDADARSCLFRELLGRETFGAVVNPVVTPRIDLHRPFEEARKTSNVRRRFRKLEGGTVEISIGAPLLAGEFDRLADVHRTAFPGAFFSSDRGRRFFSALAADASFRQCIEVSKIVHDGQIVAAHFGFACDGRLYYYVPMFDERYAQYGLGQYLLWRMMSHYRDAGFKVFDLLRGDEDYKYQWVNGCAVNRGFLGVAVNAPLWLKAVIAVRALRDFVSRLRSGGVHR